jgi:hypothetical protein
MKNGTAAGVIPAEVCMVESNVSADMLYSLFLDVWNKHFPSAWKEGIIVKIPKKEDLSNCSGWWGITLLATVSKIFSRVIIDRIMETLEKKI